jgi:NADPH:quinone reductase-like Zn-dependent oxidoreductase
VAGASYCNKTNSLLQDNVVADLLAVCMYATLQGLTALSMLKTTCEVKPNDWVLVHAAAGGTGQMLVQIASHLGAKVIGTTSTQEKANIAK